MVDRVRIALKPTTPHGVNIDGNPEAIGSTDSALQVIDVGAGVGQDQNLNRTWGGALAKKVSLSADGQIGIAGPCVYYGYIVTTILGAGVINIRDAVAAGSGDIIDIIPATSAVGVEKARPFGVYCPLGAYADFASTGTVTFFYQQV